MSVMNLMIWPKRLTSPPAGHESINYIWQAFFSPHRSQLYKRFQLKYCAHQAANKVKTVLIENLWPHLNGLSLCVQNHYTLYSKDQHNEAELAVFKVTMDFKNHTLRRYISTFNQQNPGCRATWPLRKDSAEMDSLNFMLSEYFSHLFTHF